MYHAIVILSLQKGESVKKMREEVSHLFLCLLEHIQSKMSSPLPQLKPNFIFIFLSSSAHVRVRRAVLASTSPRATAPRGSSPWQDQPLPSLRHSP